ncbi:hypothetical protein B0H12DRAFT_1077654 [Mycena haematopus]|nr:hypothetical protein B0H12DRAFT_1077654 [Mycena haematopus]
MADGTGTAPVRRVPSNRHHGNGRQPYGRPAAHTKYTIRLSLSGASYMPGVTKDTGVHAEHQNQAVDITDQPPPHYGIYPYSLISAERDLHYHVLMLLYKELVGRGVEKRSDGPSKEF